jgi:hypothetical protein
MSKTITYEIVKGVSDTFTLLEDVWAYKDGIYYHIYESSKNYTHGPFIGRWKIFTEWNKEVVCGELGPLSPPTDNFEIITSKQLIDMRKKLDNFEDYMHFGQSLA